SDHTVLHNRIVEYLDDPHGAQRVRQHHVEKVLLLNLDRRELVRLTDPCVDEEHIDLTILKARMKCLDRSEVNHVDRFDFERFRITLLKLLQTGGRTARSCDHLPTSSTVFFSKGQTEASGCAYH